MADDVANASPLLAQTSPPVRSRTRSWHAGLAESKPSTLVPSLSRSCVTLDGVTLDDDHRTFGGISRQPSFRRPTLGEHQFLKCWSAAFEEQHATKPHVVAFVNSRSGGQSGALIQKALMESIGSECALDGKVCDLSLPDEPLQTVLSLAHNLDDRSTRLLICGGDGTVTWILTELEQCEELRDKLHLLPIAIIPLGTGNDLARSLGWGSKLRSVADVLNYLRWVSEATPVELDQWRLMLRPHEELPAAHKLKTRGSHPQFVQDNVIATQVSAYIDEALPVESTASRCADIYAGLMQNYFSIGYDAKGAQMVETSRNETAVGGFCFRKGCGKVCYGWQILAHAFCTGLLTRSLQNIRVQPPGEGRAAMSDLQPPLAQQRVNKRTGHLRSLMLVNINSYGAGLDVMPRSLPAGVPSPAPADGCLEVLAMRNVLVGTGALLGLARPTYLASGSAVAFSLSGGEYMEVDGEPWGMECGCDVLVEKHRRVHVLCAPLEAPFWRGHVSRAFWGAT